MLRLLNQSFIISLTCIGSEIDCNQIDKQNWLYKLLYSSATQTNDEKYLSFLQKWVLVSPSYVCEILPIDVSTSKRLKTFFTPKVFNSFMRRSLCKPKWMWSQLNGIAA